MINYTEKDLRGLKRGNFVNSIKFTSLMGNTLQQFSSGVMPGNLFFLKREKGKVVVFLSEAGTKSKKLLFVPVQKFNVYYSLKGTT